MPQCAEHETSIPRAFLYSARIPRTAMLFISAIALNCPILSRTYGRPRRPNREEYRKQDQAHDQPMR